MQEAVRKSTAFFRGMKKDCPDQDSLFDLA